MYKKYATAIEKKITLHVMFNIEVTLYLGSSRQSIKDVFYQKTLLSFDIIRRTA